MPLPHHARYEYSPIPARADFAWPDGKRLAVYVGMNVECFGFASGLGAELAPGGPQPDVLNHAWRDYGNRVGLWRKIELFDRLAMPCTALINSEIYAAAPGLAEAFLARGDEIAGHGRSNAERQGILSETEEAALIAEATAVLTAQTGLAPKGWLGPWISQSAVTPDLLHEAGYEYLLDWCHDDQPTWMQTRKGRILSVPYPQELNDIPQIVGRKPERCGPPPALACEEGACEGSGDRVPYEAADMKYILLLLLAGCVTKQFVRDALTVEQITCALLTQATDVEEVRVACGIAEVLRPYLLDLLAAKANAARARAQAR